MKKKIRCAALLTGLLLLTVLQPEAGETARPPNFVLIVADDLGYGDIGCFGNTKNHTPHLDRLAKEGLRLTDFHSNGAMCSPTRAALLTGRYQQRVGIEGPLGEKNRGLQQDTITLAERLKEAGYVSAIYGKWHLGTIENGPFHHGFDDFKGHTTGDSDFFSRISRAGRPDWWHQDKPLKEEGYNTDLLTDYAIDFVKASKDQPFFLYVPHSAIHFPWQSPNDTDPKTHRQAGKGAKTPGLTKLGHHRDPSLAVKGMIESLDRNVGRLIGALKQLELQTNTFVFFTSDNGGYLSYNGKHRGQISTNGPLRGQKSDIYEGGHRVPTIAWWPGRIQPGRSTDETAITMDLMPTYLRLAGLEAPPADSPTALDGISLTSLLFDGQPLPQRTLLWRKGKAQAARQGPWKLIRTAGKSALYDLRTDIGEQNDVSSSHPGVVRHLEAAVAAWEKDVGTKRRPEGARGADRGAPWPRHTIDDTSQGADGTRLADVNGDGWLDIATPWEQGRVVRIYLHPTAEAVKKPWPAVTVGEVASSEDAVFVDLDADGAHDVVSACEGRTKTLFVHWAPRDAERYLEAKEWKTAAFPVAHGNKAWMYVAPLQIDGKRGVDLVCGAKGKGAQVGWLESPESPRDLEAWKWHPLYDAGWIMSLETIDMDGDGDADVLVTDRKGPKRGCLWLENPGPGPRITTRWPEHGIGSTDKEAMFLWPTDFDRDGLGDVLVAIRRTEIDYHRRVSLEPTGWEHHTFHWPERAGTGKSVAVGDIDLDGRLDIVCSAEAASKGSGVVWLRNEADPKGGGTSVLGPWRTRDISGLRGGKYDRVELLDLDRDGDLDVLTSEEAHSLGVIWYENPTKK